MKLPFPFLIFCTKVSSGTRTQKLYLKCSSLNSSSSGSSWLYLKQLCLVFCFQTAEQKTLYWYHLSPVHNPINSTHFLFKYRSVAIRPICTSNKTPDFEQESVSISERSKICPPWSPISASSRYSNIYSIMRHLGMILNNTFCTFLHL